nr:hypothetical protein [Tanacetum cinerariifolium]
DYPDCEVSRALSFVFHSQELYILSFILGIQITRIVKSLVLSVFVKSFTSSASF